MNYSLRNLILLFILRNWANHQNNIQR